MVKAIFFDIDGTLISFQTHRMPQSTKETLQRLRNKGIKLFVATGRAPKSLSFIKEFFEFDGYLAFNGQYCYSGREIIREKWIPKEDVAAITSYFQEHTISCHYDELEYAYLNCLTKEALAIYEMLGATAKIPPVEDMGRIKANKIYQMSAYVREDVEKDIFKVSENCKAARWHPAFTDIIPVDGGKNVGIDAVLSHYQIELKETMAFGDGGNDIDMLKHAEIGIAMGNAADKVKREADYITADVDDDGIAKAAEHFGI